MRGDMLSASMRVAKRGKPTDRESVAVTVRFSDGTLYGEKGRINFVDVSVDKATDTVTVRATLPNPDGVLMDSELVRVNVDTGNPREQIVIPQSALIADQQGTYVFAVEDGKRADSSAPSSCILHSRPDFRGEAVAELWAQDGLSKRAARFRTNPSVAMLRNATGCPFALCTRAALRATPGRPR
jgi:multidrug efflux pump subunit AcrA (membrane-fusion protein)